MNAGDGGTALENARLGRILGFDTWMDQNVNDIAEGTSDVATGAQLECTLGHHLDRLQHAGIRPGDIAHGDGIHAGERLIAKQNGGVGTERPRKLESAPLAA